MILKNHLISLFCFLVVASVALCPEIAAARPRTNSSAAFVTSDKLRGRVDFWKAIFTRYGEHEVVIHHRKYPQASFKVLDFRQAAKELNGVALEKLKKRVTDDRVNEVKQILRKCARGDSPDNNFEEEVYRAMKEVPGPGKLSAKCDDAVEQDLIRTQTGIKERYEQAIIRSGRYLDHIEKIFVDEYGLPPEITRMPFIESSFDYRAHSNVGASGIWQFMTRTGRLYMTINKAVDERRDPIVASRAAARYLQQAYASLGTWPLAATSYNHGIAGVAKKVRISGTNNIDDLLEDPDLQPFGFASGNFFPELLAAIEVYNDKDQLFPNIKMEEPITYNQIKLSQTTSAKSAVKISGVPEEELRRYNYALTEAVWRGKLNIPKGYSLRVPRAQSGTSVASKDLPDTEPSPKKSKAEVQVVEVKPGSEDLYVYKVKKGDSVFKIANRFGVSTGELRAQNGLGPTAGISVGQKLRIPKLQTSSTQSQKQKNHTVRPGDSWWSISRTYEVSLDALKKANQSKVAGGLKAGQVLVIPK